MTDLAADLMIANAEIKQLKAENEILRQRLDNECDSCACEIANERDSLRADLIKSLQAQLITTKSDLDRANGKIQGMTEGVGLLKAQLAEAQRKTDMAISDTTCADFCDICLHKDSGTSCERVDFDCAECDDPVCVCRCCRNEDKWEWRGNAE